MTTRPARNFTRLSLAIVVAALVIATTILASSPMKGETTTLTVTSTSTLAQPGSSSTPSTTSSAARLYDVTFRQSGACSPVLFASPWSVTLGNQTLTQPSNATLPVQGTASASNPNDSITFSVPDGTYHYTVSPGVYFQPSSGVVNVIGSDLSIVLEGPVTSCTVVISTSSTTARSGPTSSTTTSVTSSSGSTASASVITIIANGTTYQVQSSYDCVAGHSAISFNVTVASLLNGAIVAGRPGVTLYVATAQDAVTIDMGHPATWVYSSGLTNSTGFSILLSPGSYVFWTEGADLGCGASTITPLEQLTTVTVTQAIELVTT